ncbi:MAG: hypothetical protein GC181_05605 [Bacteroidetes bacterium]|nr:hypothetical protein [Bacteroidota bacterium]
MKYEKQLFLTLLILISAFNLPAQTPFRVELNERMQDDKINKSLAILPVYIFESTRIEPYSMFGVERDTNEPDLQIRQMPEMKGVHDTGYTYIYFSGTDVNAINKGYCLTIIGNYRRSRRPIYFYIDRNNNLDFTDDGPPDSLTMMENEHVFHLKNKYNPEAEHQVKITRVDYGRNDKYNQLLTEHFKKHSGKKKFSSIGYCYREQRLNTSGGKYFWGADSFVIAIKDMNNNGLFNESCVDKVYIGSVNEQVNTDEMNYIYPDVSTIFFEWNQKRYKVVAIDPAGKFIDLVEERGAPLKRKLEKGKKVQNFSFINIRNQKEELKTYRKRPVYIFFWNTTTIAKEDTMYIRMIWEEFGDQIQIITLNHGDPVKTVRITQYYDHIHWPLAFSSYQIGRVFFLEDLPRGYYLTKHRKLKSDNISPKEMYEMLKNKQVKS